MQLYSVHIENYRSIENLTLDLNKCNVLVGKNNTGKSNVLRAIDLVLGEKFFKLTKNDFFNQDDSKIIKINLLFNDFTEEELENIKQEIKYRVKVDDMWYNPEQIHEELERKKEIKIEIEISSGNINKNIFFGEIYYKYFSNELKNAIVNTIYVPSMRDHTQILRITEYSFLNKLLSKIYAKAEQNKKDELKDILKNATDKCKEIFEEYETKLDQISKTIIKHDGLRISMLPSDYKEIYKKLNLLLNDGIETELGFKGSGIQSVIIISLFKLYADLKIGGAILLIEEPESFLHPQANRHMAKILNEICQQGNIQIIITTHSPNYLEDIDLKDLVLFKKEGNSTITTQISSIQDEIKLKKELNSSNLELFFADKVILVEGQTDKILLPVFAEKFNKEYNFDKKNISIVDVGSKSNLDVFIDLLNSFKISWLALLDKDFISMTESKGLLKRMNSKFGYGIDLENIQTQELVTKLQENNIRVLTYGEIENYYSKKWLYKVLEDFVYELEIDTSKKEQIITSLSSFTDTTQKENLKVQLNAELNLDEYDLSVINKLINIKSKLINLDLADGKIGKKLESLFDELDLTKPKIALRIRPHLDLDGLPIERKEDIKTFIDKIFTFE